MKKREGWTGEWVDEQRLALTFLCEECAAVLSLGQTERGGCGRAVVTPDYISHPITD